MTEPETNPEPPRPMPEQIGNYLIEKELGAGGMGTVYLGRHVETGQIAAVKMLPASMSRETGFVARFGREVAAMQQLQSPHIVELYESGEENDIYYYAMEYVEGETLTARLLREKKLPWREVIDISVQVCKALKAAHNAGIVHRDLKPSNLLIDEDENVKLTDFGIAQVFASSKLTATGGILGTAEYMSPEQAHGARATRQSDIYSLGAVMYVMLTGRPPFTGKTTLEILQKHRFAQFDSPKRVVPEIPFWLDEIVCKCMSKKPEERYPDAYVLMLRLREVPKKVDLKASEDSLEGLPDADRETMVDTAEHHQHVGGTFVRDLFRNQMDTMSETTWLGRLFDNVWVLMALLILLVVGGLYMSRWSRPTPEQMFARGQHLMEQPEGPDWEVARTQFFNPLLDLNEEKWLPKVEPYLSKIQLYDLKKQLLGRNLKKIPIPQSEPEAIMRQALELRRLGRMTAARKKLLALEVLLEGNTDLKPLASMASHLRKELEKHELKTRFVFIREALERADRLFNEDHRAQAQAVWRSVIELYDADPDAEALVTQAKQRLSAATVQAPESSSNSSSDEAASLLSE